MVYVDPKETIDEQEKMIMKNKEDGDRHDRRDELLKLPQTCFYKRTKVLGKQSQRARRCPS